MAAKINCPNMNHGRSHVSIRHCTDCGEVLNPTVKNFCSEELHSARRKNRNIFCHDCGIRLASEAQIRR